MTASSERKNEVAEKRNDHALSMVKALEVSYKSALPSHVTMEHFSRALLTEFRRTPALMDCTRESVGSGVLMFAQLGLMLGVNGAGWLIPFNNKRGTKEAVSVIGYQGLIDLCYRSDRVESVCADVVCENDVFEYEQGLEQKLRHKPELRGTRGKPYAVYAIANIKGSSRPVYVVLNAEEVETVKNSSPGARKSDSPWNGNFATEMWKKTAIRRLCKYLPKSVELSAALDFETRQETEMKEVDATVADDPLAPGRHETKRSKRQPEPVTQPEYVADVSGAHLPPEPSPDQEPPQEDHSPDAGEMVEEENTCPVDACKDYVDLLAARNRMPRFLDKAIESAREKHGECGRVKTFGDIDHTDAIQCGLILTEFRRTHDRAKGK
ncbi:recombinase RecT [Candidatus Pacearchaeota archaeon]|jgi:recombination protein RecT|nr:recombinase RecT [Candidatus Pacearchaeota archaeon]